MADNEKARQDEALRRDRLRQPYKVQPLDPPYQVPLGAVEHIAFSLWRIAEALEKIDAREKHKYGE